MYLAVFEVSSVSPQRSSSLKRSCAEDSSADRQIVSVCSHGDKVFVSDWDLCNVTRQTSCTRAV